MEKFEDLAGKVVLGISGNVGDDEMIFKTDDGVYKLYHQQDCCETVDISDIIGDQQDVIDSPVLLAEVVTHENNNPAGLKIPEYQDSFTWTFYKLSTIKGSITIRWYGESNGYYSQEVDFVKI
jgi:hypothetical protein